MNVTAVLIYLQCYTTPASSVFPVCVSYIETDFHSHGECLERKLKKEQSFKKNTGVDISLICAKPENIITTKYEF